MPPPPRGTDDHPHRTRHTRPFARIAEQSLAEHISGYEKKQRALVQKARAQVLGS